ncbi:MAG: DNA-processing protein DprA [Kiritimatiellia bacterium]
MDEREALVALNMVDGAGPVTIQALLGAFGSAEAVTNADERQLAEVRGVSPRIAGAIVEQRKQGGWLREQEKAEKAGARIITVLDEEYPRNLKEIHDPPPVLYVRGGFVSGDRHAIAVVGSRRATHYGRGTAERLAYGLVKSGMTVVSGLAEGIDTAAHRGALSARGRTIAVIGSGLNCLYPPSNTDLAERIAQSGAVVSEFPLDRQADRSTFPIRNRVVSGLSQGTVVVEGGRRSGALITASQALEQGRTVFAVPGRIDSHSSAGANSLIKNGACLVSNVDDILNEFEFLISPRHAGDDAEGRRAPLTDREASVVALLENGESNVDALIRNTGMRPGEMSALILGLEMKKVVRMLPGRIVAKRTSSG